RAHPGVRAHGRRDRHRSRIHAALSRHGLARTAGLPGSVPVAASRDARCRGSRSDAARQAARRPARSGSGADGPLPAVARPARLLPACRAAAVTPSLAYPGPMSLVAAILLASTSLHITVWPGGMGQPGKKEYTLRCGPAAGTLPRRGAACTQLMRLNRPFAPTPKNVACTEIYGGPQPALLPRPLP